MSPPARTLNEVALDELHLELCNAINDLAKSVDVALTRMALRAQNESKIGDTDPTECVTEVIRAPTSAQSPESNDFKDAEITLTLPLLSPPQKQNDWKRDTVECGAVDQLYDACRWLEAVQIPRTAPRHDYREESKIAMGILELQTRFGGLTIK